MHYVALLMIYYKNKNLHQICSNKLTEGIIFTMQFPMATVKKNALTKVKSGDGQISGAT
jgi:hypothetical protein